MKKRILSALLMVCLVMTLVPTVALAAEVTDVDPDNVPDTVVASVTINGATTYYDAWSDVATAIAPADTETVTATITLLDNVNVAAACALHIGDYQNITLNLNEKTLSTGTNNTPGTYTIIIAGSAGSTPTTGSLTILGPGTVDNLTSNASTIRNYGTLIIGGEGMTDEDDAALIITRQTGAPLPIDTLGGRSGIKNEEESTLTIYGGTIYGDTRSIQNLGILNIYGGVFKHTVEAWQYKSYTSTIDIDGGTFTAPIQIRSRGSSDAAGWTGAGDVTITGGEFKIDTETFGNYPIISIDALVPLDYDGLSVQGGTFTGNNLIQVRTTISNNISYSDVDGNTNIAGTSGFITGGTFYSDNDGTAASGLAKYLADGLTLANNGAVVADRTGDLTQTAGTPVGNVTPYTISNAVPGLTYTIATDDPTTGISLMSFTIPDNASGCDSFTVYLFTGGSVTIWETALALEFDEYGAVMNQTLAALTIN